MGYSAEGTSGTGRSHVAKDVSDAAGEFASRAGEKVGQAMHSAESALNALQTQGREAGEQVSAVAGNLKTAVDRSVKDQPMATLAVVAALGFVLGALWKS